MKEKAKNESYLVNMMCSQEKVVDDKLMILIFQRPFYLETRSASILYDVLEREGG